MFRFFWHGCNHETRSTFNNQQRRASLRRILLMSGTSSSILLPRQPRSTRALDCSPQQVTNHQPRCPCQGKLSPPPAQRHERHEPAATQSNNASNAHSASREPPVITWCFSREPRHDTSPQMPSRERDSQSTIVGYSLLWEHEKPHGAREHK